MFKANCPMCGTHGRIWNNKPEVFICPNCSTLYSRFGIVIESEEDEKINFWS